MCYTPDFDRLTLPVNGTTGTKCWISDTLGSIQCVGKAQSQRNTVGSHYNRYVIVIAHVVFPPLLPFQDIVTNRIPYMSDSHDDENNDNNNDDDNDNNIRTVELLLVTPVC